MKRRFRTALLVAVAAVVAGCSRQEVLLDRLRGLPDETAGRVLRDALWADGSVYRWARHTTLRSQVTRTEHHPLGDVVTQEVWTLDLVGGRLRIEKPDAGQVTTFDGLAWHVFVGGKESGDLELRADAAGDALLARQVMPMPFSLLDPGLAIEHVGTRTGPGETRSWDNLWVTLGPGTPWESGDRMLLEFNRQTHRVDAVLACWWESPFLGGRWRVDMDLWWPTGNVTLSRRWRLTPIDDAGVAAGPVRWTFQVTGAEFDAAVGGGAFLRP